MASTLLKRLGQVDILIPAGQILAAASNGP